MMAFAAAVLPIAVSAAVSATLAAVAVVAIDRKLGELDEGDEWEM